MPTPISPAAYPPEFLAALDRARTGAPLTIPCPNPSSVRLQFYGLFRALRLASQADRCDGIIIHLLRDPPGIRLSRKEALPLAAAIRAALGENPAPPPALPGFEEFAARLNNLIAAHPVAPENESDPDGNLLFPFIPKTTDHG